ncbi:Glycogen synthase, ADP-glucose transglucosylase [hydrothermal vent metagenome]|uniref:starch synthase n=1 Tax=hydrothermal vent metagenome TaxID=652676 RepID=A0A3B0ZGK8_9ZZZZ
MNILFASSEAHPLIKTGGLADVCGSLPRALKNAHQDVRLVLPAYPAAISRAGKLTLTGTIDLPGASTPVRLLQGQLPGTRVKLYLIDAPHHFDRNGNPYTNAKGKGWPDNAARFALFARAICALALNQAGLDWQPDLVHCNDWQTGLVPALLAQTQQRPATVFTIHNLAYQGLFNHKTFESLGLPADWWSLDKLEFHRQLSFIKGGLVYADWLTTVSPTYAREICTPTFGCGLQGLLAHRQDTLTGILNGADYQIWSPGKDKLLPQTYTARTLEGKQVNKRALQKAFGLPELTDTPLLGHVGRLVGQKGLDLVLTLIPTLIKRQLQLVILGTGDAELESSLREAADAYPQQIAVRIEYDESLSHLLEAGSDIFLMPSRFEPCGLNQIYSLRYGTPPVVRQTGGLADTVTDSTGFSFDKISATALLKAIDRALASYADADTWQQLQQKGMSADFSWSRSAKMYLELYRQVLERRQTAPSLDQMGRMSV